MRGEDDLTYKLAEIIRANMSLRKFEEEGAPNHVVAEFETLLQVSCATGRVVSVELTFCFVHSGTSRPTWTTISLVSLKLCKSQVGQSSRFVLA